MARIVDSHMMLRTAEAKRVIDRLGTTFEFGEYVDFGDGESGPQVPTQLSMGLVDMIDLVLSIGEPDGPAAHLVEQRAEEARYAMHMAEAGWNDPPEVEDPYLVGYCTVMYSATDEQINRSFDAYR